MLTVASAEADRVRHLQSYPRCVEWTTICTNAAGEVTAMVKSMDKVLEKALEKVL